MRSRVSRVWDEGCWRGEKQPSSYWGFKYLGGQGAVPTNVSAIAMERAIHHRSDFHTGVCMSEIICNHTSALFDGIL